MTEPYYSDDAVQLWLGDCIDVLKTIPDASVDAVCTDPPYSLAFMGREWDSHETPRDFQRWCEQWAIECLRVLKPGAHLLAFGAPRTYHRLAAGIEDAGFEIRDSIHWIYGQGMPKGQDIAKAIDRRRPDRPEVLEVTTWLSSARRAAGWSIQAVDDLFGFNGMASHWCATAGKAACVPTLEQWATLRGALGFDDTVILPLVEKLNGRKGEIGEAWSRREVVGEGYRVRKPSAVQIAALSEGAYDLTEPALDAAKQWQGWNTQLRPAHEPVICARKPTGFNSTVANVLEWGTGALNIDATRTRAGQDYRDKCASVVGIASPRNGDTLGEWTGVRENSAHDLGRWPTNLLLCHTPECIQVGERTVKGDSRSGQERGTRPSHFAEPGAASGDPRPNGGLYGPEVVPVFECAPGCPVAEMDRQSGDASRFFPTFRYEAKAPASERPRLADGTAHPTCKPLDLMRWLVRLVTPPGGTILDPFAGSGTTLQAAIAEGFHAIGIEREQPYADLCVQRLSRPIQVSLFGEALDA